MEFIQSMDVWILKFIHENLDNNILDFLCPIVRNKSTWIPLYFILIYYVWKIFPNQFIKIILVGIALVVFSDLICAQVLKPLFHRLRPCQIVDYSLWLNQFPFCSHTFSFPSCHASNHSALAFYLSSFFSRMVCYLLYIWVFVICFSQAYIGVHYPSDLLMGVILGAVFGKFISQKLSNYTY